MKKLIAIAAAVVLVIAAFAAVAPVSAGPPEASERTVFEANIVPTSYATHPFEEGEVKVFADRSVDIKIKGAAQRVTYSVYLGQTYAWDLNPLRWTLIGEFTTDVEGNCDNFTESIPETIVTDPVITPVFTIQSGRVPPTDPPDIINQFASGFEIE